MKENTGHRNFTTLMKSKKDGNRETLALAKIFAQATKFSREAVEYRQTDGTREEGPFELCKDV